MLTQARTCALFKSMLKARPGLLCQAVGCHPRHHRHAPHSHEGGMGMGMGMGAGPGSGTGKVGCGAEDQDQDLDLEMLSGVEPSVVKLFHVLINEKPW